jgi:multiple sugar transport system substrate-binding protein
MKLKQLAAAALFGSALIAASPAFAQEKLTVWWGKGFYKAEDDALYAAIKKFEAKYPKYKVELSLLRAAGNDPEVGGRDGRRQPARCGLSATSTTSRSPPSGRMKASSKTSPRHRADPRQVRAAGVVDDLPLQRRGQERGPTTPSRSSSRPCTYPVLEGHAGRGGFKESDIPKDWKAYWEFWCEKVQGAYRQKTGKRGFSTGFPMGVDSSDSFYSFLTFVDAYNVKLVERFGQAAGR